jgi:hypothetical protein
MSLFIIAQLFLLRAIDSFKRSSRWGGSNEGRSTARNPGLKQQPKLQPALLILSAPA